MGSIQRVRVLSREDEATEEAALILLYLMTGVAILALCAVAVIVALIALTIAIGPFWIFAIPPAWLYVNLEQMGFGMWGGGFVAVLLTLLEAGLVGWTFSQMSETTLSIVMVLFFGGSWFAVAWVLANHIPVWGLVLAPIIGAVIGRGWIEMFKTILSTSPQPSVTPAVSPLSLPSPAASPAPDPFARWRQQRADARLEPSKLAAHRS